MGQDDVAVLVAKLESMCNDLGEVKTDVKSLKEEGLPRRVGKLEQWRETMSGRFWGFASSVAVVALGSTITVVITLIRVTI